MKRYWSLSIAVMILLTSVLGVATPIASVHAATLSVTRQELNRRAAQHLEDLRNSGMAQKWGNARLGRLRAMLRPGMSTVAYYEYAVVAGTTPVGFIILSAGKHDFPIAHWNDQGESPSASLSRMAAAKQQTVARFYKLDTLTYAAENSVGELIALYPPNSRLPTNVSGQTPAMLDQRSKLTHETWSPSTRDETAQPRHARTQSGPAATDNIKLGGWASWGAFKEGFTKSYQTMLLAHERKASHDWEIESTAAKSGEGIIVGKECKQVASLFDSVQVAVRGDGAKFVSATVRTRTGLPTVIELCARVSPPQEGLRADLALTYGNGQTELLPFAVLSESYADNKPESAQLEGRGTLDVDGAASLDADAPQGAWGPWTYYWAGSSGDQRYYSQISAGTYNNTTSCFSGCGATAWAMLFGWADKQAASGNAYWAPRWGIYRANGGTGADAVAPSGMDSGIRTITMDIRNRIGTFCSFGSGATAPWDMDGAAGYLSGRTGTSLSTHYNVLGIHEDRLREYARNSIRDRDTPAIIGTGWLTHYPLAWGYAWQSRTVNVLWWTETEYNRSFYVNQGWGGSGDGWVSASTWFAGEITP